MLACKLQVCVAPFPIHLLPLFPFSPTRQAGRQAVSLSVPVPLPVPDLCTRPSLTPIPTLHLSIVVLPCLFVGINISYVVFVVVVACLFVCLFKTLQHFCSAFLFVCLSVCFSNFLSLVFLFTLVTRRPVSHCSCSFWWRPERNMPPPSQSNRTTGVACILSIIHGPLLENYLNS